MPKKPKTNAFDPSAWQLPPVYEWETCDKPEVNEGLTQPLKAQVLVNPPRGEIIALTRAVQDVFKQARDRVETAGEDAGARTDAASDSTDDAALFRLVAPRLIAWNVQAVNGSGELADVPPPADTDGQSMQVLNTRQALWLVALVQQAHLGGQARAKHAGRPAPTASGGGGKTPNGTPAGPTLIGAPRPSRQTNC